MVRVAVSVEGMTEEQFVKSVLAPFFQVQNIYLQPISMQGNISIDRVKHEVENLLYSYDYVTTLYDFYGFKRKEEGETKESLEQRIELAVKPGVRDKFIPYIQMYEFEGLLFASPSALASVLQSSELEGWAVQILQSCENNPEKINNSVETAPSKRLEKHKKIRYKKTVHGSRIAKEIGVEKLRQKCSGFHDWLLRLEVLKTS